MTYLEVHHPTLVVELVELAHAAAAEHDTEQNEPG